MRWRANPLIFLGVRYVPRSIARTALFFHRFPAKELVLVVQFLPKEASKTGFPGWKYSFSKTWFLLSTHKQSEFEQVDLDVTSLLQMENTWPWTSYAQLYKGTKSVSCYLAATSQSRKRREA